MGKPPVLITAKVQLESLEVKKGRTRDFFGGTGSPAADRELQATFKRQGHRAQFVPGIVHKSKVVFIRESELPGVIANDDCAFAQAMCHQFEGNSDSRIKTTLL